MESLIQPGTFSSPTFVFLFLPLVLVVHLIPNMRWRNLWLLLAGLSFYGWGEPSFFILIVLSSLVNWLLALIIAFCRRHERFDQAKFVLVFAIALNLSALLFYKYSTWLLSGLRELGLAPGATYKPWHLPLGISFFTFQAISYVVDTYRKETVALRNPLDYSLYHTLFPQLVAGPIVRYVDIAHSIPKRVIESAAFAEGIRRFVIGLGKKVIIANTLAGPADRIFALSSATLSPLEAWLGALCYAFQIYFDFSGYSDMAIGIGHMLGFTFLENFNYPYIARSVQDFWHRWHISLSTWFRDYLYIPLGGSRKGTLRTYFNLLLVFFLCGLWHGANLTFIVWGLFHGFFLILERTRFSRLLARLPLPLRHVYAGLVVLVGWVLFRAENLDQAAAFLAAMFGFNSGTSLLAPAVPLGSPTWLVFALATIASTPLWPKVDEFITRCTGRRRRRLELLYDSWLLAMTLGVLIACGCAWAAGTYNPFIYFRF